MTSKLSWIGFVPFAICAIVLKFAQMFFINDDSATLFGLTSFQLSYVAMGLSILVLVITMIFCFADKKISPYYNSKRNIFCGIFALILALMFAADGANIIFNMFETASFSVINIIEAVFLIFSAISFVVIGMYDFVKDNNSQKLLKFLLIPAILMAVRLVKCFMTFRTISIIYSDITLLLCYIFATMFFFNHAVLMSKTEARNPVKSCFIYGFPMLVVLFMYTIPNIYTQLTTDSSFDFFLNLENFELLVVALYALGFIIELSVNAKRKDEVEIINETVNEDKDIKDSEDTITEQASLDQIDEKNLVFDSDEDLSQQPENQQTEELNSEKDNNDASKDLNDDLEYEKNDNDNLKDEINTKSENSSQEKKIENRMDEIDRLIREISSKDND